MTDPANRTPSIEDHLREELAQARAERDGWMETARGYANGLEFYRDLVTRIGEPFGVAARTSDDGSVQDSVLVLRVPELVEAQRAKLADARADVERLREERDGLARAAAGYKMMHEGGIDLANRYLDDVANAEGERDKLAERLMAVMADVERLLEQSESWRLAYLAWSAWAEELLRVLGLQPSGGLLGDEPARERLAAVTAERDRLLELLEPTEANIRAIADALARADGGPWDSWGPDVQMGFLDAAAAALAAIRARAGITDSVPAGRAPPVGGDSPCGHPAPAGEGPEAGTISPQPVPYGHCNRCARCGGKIGGVEAGTVRPGEWNYGTYDPARRTRGCWVTVCFEEPPPPLRTHCAGCGAPFEADETKGTP